MTTVTPQRPQRAPAQKSFVRRRTLVRRVIESVIVLGGAGIATVGFFVILPLLQVMAADKSETVQLSNVDNARVPPPPPPEPDPPKQEEEQEKEPPKLADEAPPPDFSQLEMVLGGGGGSGFLGKGFGVDLKAFGATNDFDDESFSMGDVDQVPRPTYTPPPPPNARLAKRAPATVYLLFIVKKNGRVGKVIVEGSTDALFERVAVRTIKKWRFEAGRKNGKPVDYRMKMPYTFPKGR